MADFAPLAAEYGRLWSTMAIKTAIVATVDVAARRLLRDRPRYAAVSRDTGVPAALIMVIHERESGARFDRHLHNGDPLSARTVQVPAGRPKAGRPPFTWEESAADALRYQGLDRVTPAQWTIERACEALEAYNGLGYRRRGLRTPYLWAGTNHQQPGKYVADGRFDPSAIDRQLGACAILQRLMTLEPSLVFDHDALAPKSAAGHGKAETSPPGGRPPSASQPQPSKATPPPLASGSVAARPHDADVGGTIDPVTGAPRSVAAGPLAAMLALSVAAAAAFAGGLADLRDLAVAFFSSLWN